MFLPALLFFFYYSYTSKEKEIIALVIGCITTFIINILINYLLPSSIQFYSFISFAILEFLFFLLFYYLSIKIKKGITVALISFLLFSASAIIDFSRPNFQFNSISVGVETIIIISLSIIFFYVKVKEIKTTNSITDDYRFWVIIGILLYLTGSFFIYLYTSQIGIREMKKLNLWFLTWVFYIFKSLFISIAILIFIKSAKKNSIDKTKSLPFLDMI